MTSAPSPGCCGRGRDRRPAATLAACSSDDGDSRERLRQTSRSASPWAPPARRSTASSRPSRSDYEEQVPGSNGRDHHPGGRHLRDHRTQQPPDLAQRPRRLLRASRRQARRPRSTTATAPTSPTQVAQPASPTAFDPRRLLGDGRSTARPTWSRGAATSPTSSGTTRRSSRTTTCTPPTTWAEFMDCLRHPQGGRDHATDRRQQGQVASRQHRLTPRGAPGRQRRLRRRDHGRANR